MKRILSVILAAACLLAFAVGAASADGGTWRCVTCGEDRDTAFCPVCGAARPAEETEDTWICPACGKELPAEYAFCPDDGSGKETASGAPWEVISLEGRATAPTSPTR